jgi:hypothetical protein
MKPNVEPPPTQGANRDSETDRANGGWNRRLADTWLCDSGALSGADT